MGLRRRRNEVIRPRRDGRFDLILAPRLREVLEDSIDQVDELLEDPDLPILRRLAPNPYVDDPEQAEAWRLLAGDQLRSAQRETFVTLRRIHASDVVDVDELWTWIRALNTLRLVVGTALGIEDDDVDLPEPEPDDPARGLWELYQIATFVQFEIVTELAGSVEDRPTGG